MTARFRALLYAGAVFTVTWLAACGEGDTGSARTAPATVVIAVSESRTAPALGETKPSGIFVVVRYVLANGADEDIVVSQDDFTLVAKDGTVLQLSVTGTAAWGRSPGGYELTETVLLKPGGMPRSWVSVFEVPRGEETGVWTFQYKNEPPVSVPAPSSE